mgnify:CR=1 FL=1
MAYARKIALALLTAHLAGELAQHAGKPGMVDEAVLAGLVWDEAHAACSAAAEQLLKPSPGEVIADQLGDIGFHYSGIPEAAQPFVGPVLKYLNSHDVFEAIISYIPPPNPIYP